MIAPDVALIDGINAIRNVLNRCWFDEIKCATGIKVLENYKKSGMIVMDVGLVVPCTILQVMELMHFA